MHAGASTNSPAFTPHRKTNIEHVGFPPRRLPGMAAIAVDEYSRAMPPSSQQHPPGYARPLFLRILRKLEVTTTFKHKKSDLARAGFAPS
jgi:hypothetical protein